MRNYRLFNIALLLLTLFQSVVALADVHETFGRSAADHLSEHQPAHHTDQMQTLTDDIQTDNQAQHDCSHCCHCHAHAPLSLPVNDTLTAATKCGSMNNLYTRTLIVRALSPHLRPPIVS
ncbi:MAG: hypothetical protein LRY66_10400 [Saccharospirillaceae bacterium]|nr:hypothetical protein [Saccharospirillaceae bacterium]MCD8531745.1 hypothetical protein [Saccharospirillaceae bacterium]